jgi:competence protein ComEC
MKRWPLNNSFFWEPAPFFRLLIPLTGGILAYDAGLFHMLTSGFFISTFTILFIIQSVFVFIPFRNIYQIPHTVTVFTILLLTGVACCYFSDIRNNNDWFGNHLTDYCAARITDNPTDKTGELKISASIVFRFNKNTAIPTFGDAIVYCRKDEFPCTFKKGDTILLPPLWHEVKNSGNPFCFDYATYCHRNNLYYSISCKRKDIKLLGGANKDFAPFMERAHDWCVEQLERSFLDASVRGLIKAMVIGDVSGLDEEVKQSWTDTGIIHVIAISGSNITLFFAFFGILLGRRSKAKHKWIQYSIALPVGWFYIFLAGAPPSAVRAGIMFTVITLAVLLQKQNRPLNQLFAAAFFLLLSAPMWLFSLGFQLSFVAVLSLVLFYPPLSRAIQPKNKILKQIWEAAAASIAAEILSAPVVILYFHNFPFFFLPANIIAALLMVFATYAAFALLALFWFPGLQQAAGTIISFLINNFNSIIYFFHNISPEALKRLVLSPFEWVLLTTVVICGVSFSLWQTKKAALAALAAFLLLTVLFCRNEWIALHSRNFVVYNMNSAVHVEITTGNCYRQFHKDYGLPSNTEFATKSAHINWRVFAPCSDTIPDLFTISGKTVLLLRNPETNVSAKTDILVVCYKKMLDIQGIRHFYQPQTIVFPLQYSKKQIAKLNAIAAEQGINLYFVHQRGAYMLQSRLP